jgi:hypothetical protein
MCGNMALPNAIAIYITVEKSSEREGYLSPFEKFYSLTNKCRFRIGVGGLGEALVPPNPLTFFL